MKFSKPNLPFDVEKIGICWLNISAWTLIVLPQASTNCSGCLKLSFNCHCWLSPWRKSTNTAVERGAVGELERILSVLPVPFWALTVFWFAEWDKALNLCVSKSKWWILPHLHCLLTDGSSTWLTALFPHFFDLKMPASWGVAMQRYVACRASEEVSGTCSMMIMMMMKLTWLLSKCQTPRRMTHVEGEPGRVWRAGKSCIKRKKKWGFTKAEHTPTVTIAKLLIIAKLVQNQMAGQIFDELLEIKSAKCCWHLATKPTGDSLTL